MRFLLALLAALAFVPANAQTVPGSVNLNWTLPTTGCTVGVTPCDSKPLTGSSALTSVQVFVSGSPILDTSTMIPTATLAPGATTGQVTMSVTNGSTLYARIKACNTTCGPFSAQVSKLISLDITPGVPTSVTITIQIG